MKKILGRPKVPKDKAKGIFFAARFEPSEAERLNQAIAKSGLSKSEWIRKTLISACE